MKKQIISAICICMVLILSAGCGKTGKVNSDSSKKDNTSSTLSDNSISSSNNSSSTDTDDSSSSTGGKTTKTVTTTVPKKERVKDTETEEKINPKYLLENDTTVKDEIKLGKYKYVWGDEFDGNSLNSNKWSLMYDGADEKTDLYYTADNFKVSDGTLTAVTKRYYTPENSAYRWSTAPNFMTNNTMNYQYGYLEMRAKVPFKQGCWPSFWLVSKGNNNMLIDPTPWYKTSGFSMEVDIFEVFGSLDTLAPNLHIWPQASNKQHTQAPFRAKYTYDDNTFLNDEYHIYGCEWNETEISMYVDGEKYNTFKFADRAKDADELVGFSQPQYVIIGSAGPIVPTETSNDAMGLKTVDADGEPSDLPFEMSVDWIRLYQEPGKGMLKTK